MTTVHSAASSLRESLTTASSPVLGRQSRPETPALSPRTSISSLSRGASPTSTSPTAKSFAHDAKLAQIIAHFSNPKLELPIDENEAATDRGYLGGWAGGFGAGMGKKAPLTEDEKFWLSRQCILRYLEATRGDVQQAITRLTATLVWRRSFGVDKLNEDPLVELEASRKKHFYYRHSVHGHPIHYVCPVEHASYGGEEQIRHAVWFMEMGQARYKGEDGASIMLADMRTSRTKSPSLAVTRQALSILQNHYPNRLHLCYLRNMSPIMAAFLPLTYAFLDQRTRAKLRIDVDPLEEGVVQREDLLVDWGGDAKFEVDHPGWFEEMRKEHAEWKVRAMERWRKLGGNIGEDERLLKDDLENGATA